MKCIQHDLSTKKLAQNLLSKDFQNFVHPIFCIKKRLCEDFNPFVASAQILKAAFVFNVEMSQNVP